MIEAIRFLAIALVITFVPAIASFKDDAIFEEEDIYNEALPPLPNTGLTAPGTKWCGPGNSSTHYDDLGIHRDTDICCRAHDHCPQIIEAESSLHSLENNDLFPILKCSCEQEFLNCLQNVNSLVSNMIGRAYFGIRTKCFTEAHPILECIEHQESSIFRRCIRYKLNQGKPKSWQFFDIPFYSIGSAEFKEKIKN